MPEIKIKPKQLLALRRLDRTAALWLLDDNEKLTNHIPLHHHYDAEHELYSMYQLEGSV